MTVPIRVPFLVPLATPSAAACDKGRRTPPAGLSILLSDPLSKSLNLNDLLSGDMMTFVRSNRAATRLDSRMSLTLPPTRTRTCMSLKTIGVTICCFVTREIPRMSPDSQFEILILRRAFGPSRWGIWDTGATVRQVYVAGVWGRAVPLGPVKFCCNKT